MKNTLFFALLTSIPCHAASYLGTSEQDTFLMFDPDTGEFLGRDSNNSIFFSDSFGSSSYDGQESATLNTSVFTDLTLTPTGPVTGPTVITSETTFPANFVLSSTTQNSLDPLTLQSRTVTVTTNLISFASTIVIPQASPTVGSSSLSYITNPAVSFSLQGSYTIVGPTSTVAQDFLINFTDPEVSGNPFLGGNSFLINQLDIPNSFRFRGNINALNFGDDIVLFSEVVDGIEITNSLDNLDFSFFQPVFAIPEPSSLSLLLLGGLLTFKRRR